MWSRVRNIFVTGMVVLFPVVITFYLLWGVFQFADGILGGYVAFVLGRPVPGLGIVLTVVIVFAVGLLARNFLGRRLIRLGEFLLLRTPMVRSIYTTSKQIIDTFVENRSAFKQVVLVECPRRGTYAVGFVTGNTVGEIKERLAEDIVNVFVPTTPNPTSGFLLLVPRRDVIFLRMSVQEGIKLVISAGVVGPGQGGQEKEPAAAATDPGPFSAAP